VPYITKERREEVDAVIDAMVRTGIKADGDLNYILFCYCKHFMPKSYNELKSYIGELEECVAEIRRRILAPYEDMKIKENGDV
jgi:hypothetical protein